MVFANWKIDTFTMDEAIVTSLFSGSNLSHHAIARAHRIPPSTLGHRLRGRADRFQGHASQAKLSKAEENTLAQAVERLCNWHWLRRSPACAQWPRIFYEHVQGMLVPIWVSTGQITFYANNQDLKPLGHKLSPIQELPLPHRPILQPGWKNCGRTKTLTN